MNSRQKRSGRVVITGIGVVSPNGLGVAEFTQNLRAGQSGIDWIKAFDTSPLRVGFAGHVERFKPESVMDARDLRRVGRLVPLAVAASREALAMAGIACDPANVQQSQDMAVLLGTGGGALGFIEPQYKAYFTGDGKYSPFTVPAGTHGNISSEISIALGLRGFSHVVSTGCASSTDAIGYAMLHIQRGDVPMVLAGGADAPITEGILKGFELMRILAAPTDPVSRASRPFNRDRDGFVLGEGSWMFLLEDADHAEKRGATVLAEVCGWGSTCDAYHRVAPAPDAMQSARAISMAMEDAGIQPAQIDYVNLHGTGTQMNDGLETAGVVRALGPRAAEIPCSSTKSMIGHPQGACGAAGIAATILSLRAGFIHPTINLTDTDPLCTLNYVPNESIDSGEAQWALCNCIAFGSKNSALVIRVIPGTA